MKSWKQRNKEFLERFNSKYGGLQEIDLKNKEMKLFDGGLFAIDERIIYRKLGYNTNYRKK